MRAVITLAAAVASLFTAVVCFAFVWTHRESAVRGFRAVIGMIALYFFAVYALVLLGVLGSEEIGPTYLRPALVVLMLVPALDTLVDWKRRGS